MKHTEIIAAAELMKEAQTLQFAGNLVRSYADDAAKQLPKLKNQFMQAVKDPKARKSFAAQQALRAGLTVGTTGTLLATRPSI